MSGKQTFGFNDPLQAETDYLLSLVLLHASYLCPLLFLNFFFLSFFGKRCVPILISGWIFLLFLWYERSFNEARTIVSNGTRAFIMQTNVCQLVPFGQSGERTGEKFEAQGNTWSSNKVVSLLPCGPWILFVWSGFVIQFFFPPVQICPSQT